MSLLGHILRKEENYPERKSACDSNFIRTQAKHKRPYGPREHWWDSNMKLAFEMITAEQGSYCFTTDWKAITNIIGDEFQLNNIQHHLAIAAWAADRLPPFGKPKKTIYLKEERKEKREKRNLFYRRNEKRHPVHPQRA